MSANLKYKSFRYNTNLSWLEGRAGTLTSDDKPELRVASPPEFQGEEGVWTPEDLFVAAVNICTMTTFLAFAGRKQLSIRSYTSGGEGLLEFVDGSYRFTTIKLTPEIEVTLKEDVERAEELLHRAHEKCLIANSITGKVEIEPVIKSV